MASPAAPLTPPAEPSSTQTLTQTQSQTLNITQQATTQSSGQTGSSRVEALLAQPLTSLTDDGTSKRPRDHRLIHLLLNSHGINAYQERVPLQLMDFAYRYTSTILSDALHIQLEGYDQSEGGAGGKKDKGGKSGAAKADEGDVSLAALRMSIASRLAHQFTGQGNLPKEYLKQLADERNRISLQQQLKDDKSAPGASVGGVRLPHERYCLTGMGWGLKNEWESEGEESDEEIDFPVAPIPGDAADTQMEEAGDDMEEEDEGGNMEDVFGPDGGADGKDGDAEMQDS
jgi:transcription initiation factor TFIID subunit 9B